MFTVSDMWKRTWIKSDAVQRITIFSRKGGVSMSGSRNRSKGEQINFDDISIELANDGKIYLSCQQNPNLFLRQTIEECTRVSIVFLPYEELPTIPDFWKGETEELKSVEIYKDLRYYNEEWTMSKAVMILPCNTQDVQEKEEEKEE